MSKFEYKWFEATYDDDSVESFSVDADTARGDIGRVLAGEAQRRGDLPRGKIVSVRPIAGPNSN